MKKAENRNRKQILWKKTGKHKNSGNGRWERKKGTNNTKYKQGIYVHLLVLTAFVTIAKGAVCKVADERLLLFVKL